MKSDKKNPRKSKKLTIFQKTSIIICSLFFILFISTTIFFIVESLRYPGLSWFEIYQNLANPYVRIVKITEGLRKEEVADRFAYVFGWTDTQKQAFINTSTTLADGHEDGYYFPETYLIPINASSEFVATKIHNEFIAHVLTTELHMKSGVVNTDTIIKIASIIQREAHNKSDMGIISGIIWNRIFQGIPLGMDATIQYQKGTEAKWWPQITPADIATPSPYNTYLNKGLPPTAISNPGIAAIEAALKPTPTKALFYIHDKNGIIHPAITYAEHLANIKKYY